MFTGDSSKLPENEATDLILEKENNGDNIEEIQDIVTFSSKDRQGKFDELWDEAANTFDELCIRDERRKDSVLHKSKNTRSMLYLKELLM